MVENNNDFGFYGEEAEDNEVKDIKGVTDEVSEFVYSDMEYPCICLKNNLKMPEHKWVVISKLVKQGVSDKNISVYMIRGGDLYKIGALSGTQIKAFLDIVGIDNMVGFNRKDVKLIGDKLYALSSIF